MKINWCAISFKFNFLGEAIFKTFPENTNGDIFLIHAGKPEGLTADFNHFGRAAAIFEVKDELHHGQNLDRILIEQVYREIIDCDWLVMFDHDLYINDQEYLLRMIAENCSSGSLAEFVIIACENYWKVPGSNYIRHFLTTPLLVINMHYQWRDAISWDFILKEQGGESTALSQIFYDTGQRLAEDLGLERIKCYPRFPDHVLHHFSSEWQWMSDPHYKKYEPDRFEAAVSRIKLLLRDGVFLPSEREIPMMRRYLFFREVLDQLHQEGFGLG